MATKTSTRSTRKPNPKSTPNPRNKTASKTRSGPRGSSSSRQVKKTIKGGKEDDSTAEEEERNDSDVDDGADEDDEYEEADDESAGGGGFKDDGVSDEDIDADSDFEEEVKGKKRKRGGSAGRKSPSKNGASAGGNSAKKQKIVKQVEGPKTQAPKGEIAKSTMDFLSLLAIDENNDRNWFYQHDKLYRHALDNWLEFLDALNPKMTEADFSIPTMPAKDFVHRIHRDVRFTNDKTPYKQNLSAAFSRTGRKGPFAAYYIHIQPGDNSIMAAGKWAPDKNDLATIRTAILRNSKRLRRVIENPEFVKLFGPAKEENNARGKKGGTRRCNIFGREDALKTCPKIRGVTKDHKDIDLLKLKTICVIHQFSDEEVLSPDFLNNVANVARIMAPLVQQLNEMLVPSSDSENSSDDDDGDEEEEENEQEEPEENGNEEEEQS